MKGGSRCREAAKCHACGERVSACWYSGQQALKPSPAPAAPSLGPKHRTGSPLQGPSNEDLTR